MKFTFISYQVKIAVDGNSINMAISKKDIVIRNKIIKALKIYKLIIKLVYSQLSANLAIFMQNLFLKIVTVFELKYFKCFLKFFCIVKLDMVIFVAAYSASSTSLEHRLVQAATGCAPSVEVSDIRR